MLAVLRDLREPQCRVRGDWLASDPELRVEVAEVDAHGQLGAFETWLPFYRLLPVAEPGHSLTVPRPIDEFPIRLIARSDRSDQILIDEARRDGAFVVPASLLASGGLRYKFMRYSHDLRKWQDASAYSLLGTSVQSLEIPGPIHALGMPAAVPELPANVAPFLFTIDVEVNLRYQRLPDVQTAVDEHVFGVTPGGGDKEYGIRFLMDALEAHGSKGTFFVDVLMTHQVGERNLRRIVDAITERGHDLQLHLHPNPNLYYSSESSLRELGITYARTRNLESFKRAFALSCETFERFVGRPPLAFRNGSYAFADEYFDVLKQHGIRFDSSIYAFKNASVSPWLKTRSTAFRHSSGVIELPVTWVVLREGRKTRVRQHALHLGSDGARIDGSISTLSVGTAAPTVMVLHSYSMLKEQRNLPAEDQARWDEQLKAQSSAFVFECTQLGSVNRKITMDGPNPERIERLSQRLALVASIPNGRAVTFSDLANWPLDRLVQDRTVDPLVEFDVALGIPRVTGLRRYGRSYLEHLNDHG